MPCSRRQAATAARLSPTCSGVSSRMSSVSSSASGVASVGQLLELLFCDVEPESAFDAVKVAQVHAVVARLGAVPSLEHLAEAGRSLGVVASQVAD